MSQLHKQVQIVGKLWMSVYIFIEEIDVNQLNISVAFNRINKFFIGFLNIRKEVRTVQ